MHGCVSIPSNRGKPSDLMQLSHEICMAQRLNPLKSGQAFGPMYISAAQLFGVSLNPLKSGQAFGHTAQGTKSLKNMVSIPSNRGKPSDAYHHRGDFSIEVRLNPLKSGQAFGLNSPSFGRRFVSGVSIPSNRGKPSDSWEQKQPAVFKRSQSPQIGASLRTRVPCQTKQGTLQSQSPQIGASLRTLWCTSST